MKKLLIIAAVLLMFTGCTQNNNNGGSNSGNQNKGTTQTVKIFKGSYSQLLDEATQSDLNNMGMGMDDNEITVLGQKLTDYEFTSTTGEKVKLPEKGPYIFEVVGSWCGYCQALTGVIVNNNVYQKIPVYQYFMYGTADDAATFYEAVGVAKPDAMTALVENEEFEKFLQDHEFYSVPLTFLVNEDGKISLTHLGYVDVDPLNKFIDYGLKAKIYETKVEGMTLGDYIDRQNKIRQYINNLEEIEVPKSLFD